MRFPNLSRRELALLACLFLAALGGYAHGRDAALSGTAEGALRMKKYVNKELDFELSHPAMLDDVQAHPDKVVFGNKKDPEETNFTVFVEQTEYVSLQDWLAAQPEGSADVDGYQLLLWLNGGATALVAETEITKRNAKGEAIDGGKRLWAVALRNRRLYKVSSPGFFPLNSVPNVNQGRMRIFTSFLTPALP